MILLKGLEICVITSYAAISVCEKGEQPDKACEILGKCMAEFWYLTFISSAAISACEMASTRTRPWCSFW